MDPRSGHAAQDSRQIASFLLPGINLQLFNYSTGWAAPNTPVWTCIHTHTHTHSTHTHTHTPHTLHTHHTRKYAHTHTTHTTHTQTHTHSTHTHTHHTHTHHTHSTHTTRTHAHTHTPHTHHTHTHSLSLSLSVYCGFIFLLIYLCILHVTVVWHCCITGAGTWFMSVTAKSGVRSQNIPCGIFCPKLAMRQGVTEYVCFPLSV